MKEKILYFIIGALICGIIFISISASTTNNILDENNGIGRYQIIMGDSEEETCVIDTKTGAVVRINLTKALKVEHYITGKKVKEVLDLQN